MLPSERDSLRVDAGSEQASGVNLGHTLCHACRSDIARQLGGEARIGGRGQGH
jgi:hypothetical protein